MKTLILAALAVACAALCACSPLAAMTGAPGRGGSELSEAIRTIATDPNCGHTDRLNVTLGPIPTGSIFLERNCPGPADRPADRAPAAAAPSVATPHIVNLE